MKNKLAYFISKFSMFGIGFFLILSNNGKNSWIAIVLGTLLGLTVIYIYSLLKREMKNKSLKEIFNLNMLGTIYRIIFILFIIFIITEVLIILVTFVSYFYLVNTPKIIILLPFVLLALYLSCKEKNILTNMSYFLFFFSFFIVTIFALLLSKYIDFENIKPLINFNTLNVFESSLVYASITSIPQILTIDYYNKYSYVFKDYLIASTINLLITICTILCLGNPLIEIYNFPEYANLKQIKILDFIENIENISAIGWYCETFMMLSLLISNLKNHLSKKHNLLFLNIILLSIILIVSKYFGQSYELILKFFYYYPFILAFFFLIFITLFIYLKFNNKKLRNIN